MSHLISAYTLAALAIVSYLSWLYRQHRDLKRRRAALTRRSACSRTAHAAAVALLAWLATAGLAIRRMPLPEKMLGFALLATLVVHSLLDSPLYIVTEGTWYPLMLGILAAGAYTTGANTQPDSSDKTRSATSSAAGHSG